jgi:hypothetical protein
MRYPAKTFAHGDDIFVEIPDFLLAEKGWQIGDTLSVTLTNGGLHFERVDEAALDQGDVPKL